MNARYNDTQVHVEEVSVVLVEGCDLAEYALSSRGDVLGTLAYDCFLHPASVQTTSSMREESQSLGEVPSVLTPRSEEIVQKLCHRSAMAVNDQQR